MSLMRKATRGGAVGGASRPSDIYQIYDAERPPVLPAPVIPVDGTRRSSHASPSRTNTRASATSRRCGSDARRKGMERSGIARGARKGIVAEREEGIGLERGKSGGCEDGVKRYVAAASVGFPITADR